MINRDGTYTSRYFVPNEAVKRHCAEFDGRHFRLFKGENVDKVRCSEFTRSSARQFRHNVYRGYGGKDVSVEIISEDDERGIGTLCVSCEGCVFQKAWRQEITVQQENVTW